MCTNHPVRRVRATAAVAALLSALVWAPRDGRGNAAVVDFLSLDDPGESRHVIPRGGDGVRMAAERVVLVPHWDAASSRAHVLVAAWYDLVSERPQPHLPVGFPEVKGAYQVFHNTENPGSDQVVKTDQPTIGWFSARVGGHRLAVKEHPGVGRYRRWFTFEVPLRARERVRLHVRYVARVGRTLSLSRGLGVDNPESGPGGGSKSWVVQSAEYFIDYVLHTGSRWSGTIGQGEVVLFAEGRLHPLKRFVNLKPTVKDDLTVLLPVGRLALTQNSFASPRHYEAGWTPPETIDELGLVRESGRLTVEQEESLGANAVDGDPATAWISPARRGVGAWLQLPSDPGRALGSLRITGVVRAGVSRPSKLEVSCLERQRGAVRSRALGTVALPDTTDPHLIPTGSARGCAALRLKVLSLHGRPALPVGIAEVEQRYSTVAAGAPAGVSLKACCHDRSPSYASDTRGRISLPERTLTRMHPALAKIPKADLDWGNETARIADVRWSADGKLVHYLLWLENEDSWAMLLGHVVEVATGRVVARYQVDTAGTLPAPEKTRWQGALTFEQGTQLLGRHAWVPALLRRVGPPGTPARGAPQLRASLPPLCGRLQTRPQPTGFDWWYEPNLFSKVQTVTQGTIALHLAGAGSRTTTLAARRPDLVHGFARLHATVRERRRKLVAQQVLKVVEWREAGGLQREGRPDPTQVHAGLFPRVYAYSGEVRLHWHPRSQAVLAAWRDVRELTALLPDSLIKIDNGWTLTRTWLPGSWQRLDYGLSRVAVTIHPLVQPGPTSPR